MYCVGGRSDVLHIVMRRLSVGLRSCRSVPVVPERRANMEYSVQCRLPPVFQHVSGVSSGRTRRLFWHFYFITRRFVFTDNRLIVTVLCKKVDNIKVMTA